MCVFYIWTSHIYNPQARGIELTDRASANVSDILSSRYTESHLSVQLTLDVRHSITLRIIFRTIGYTYIIARASPKLPLSLSLSLNTLISRSNSISSD